MDITLDHAAPTLDYFRLDQDLPVEALALRDRVRTFGAEQVLPVLPGRLHECAEPFVFKSVSASNL